MYKTTRAFGQAEALEYDSHHKDTIEPRNSH